MIRSIRWGVFNPLSVAELCRYEEISMACKHVDLLVLPGTQRRKKLILDLLPFFVGDASHHVVLEWGFAPSPFTNKSAGLSICVAKCGGFGRNSIARVWSPPRVLQGRRGACRIKTWGLDLHRRLLPPAV